MKAANHRPVDIFATAPNPQPERSLDGDEIMTSKERVLTTLSCGAADRVPIDYDANPGIDARLNAFSVGRIAANAMFRSEQGYKVHR